jgi:hypothetical protein
MVLPGEHSELGDARAAMDKSLKTLQEATGYAILRNTEKLKSMNEDLTENSEMHTKMLSHHTEMLKRLEEGGDAIHSDIKKLLQLVGEQKKALSGSNSKSSKANQGKPPTSNRIRSFLSQVNGDDVEYLNLEDSKLPDTCTWIFSDPVWEAWMNEENRSTTLLEISGGPGEYALSRPVVLIST